MSRYFFDLSDGGADVRDENGTDLPDDRAAIAYGHQVAHDLMRNDESHRRRYSLSVYDVARQLLFTLPLVAVDGTLSMLSPETRALVETCYARRRDLVEAVHAARLTIQRSRALVARSQGMPYLAAVNGEAVL